MKLLSGIISAIILTACASAPHAVYTFDQLKPAKYDLPGRSILLVDMVEDIDLKDSTYWKERELDSTVPKTADIVLALIGNRINNTGYAKTTICTKRVQYDWLKKNGRLLVEEMGAEGILAIKKCDISLVSEVFEGQEALARIYTGIEIDTEMSIFDRMGRETVITPRRDSIDWDIDDFGDQTSATYKNHYFSSCNIVSDLCASELLPNWSTVEREVWGNTSREMTEACRSVEQGNWERAKDIFANLYQNGDESEKVYAAYDIALYYESIDNSMEAAMWFSKAIDMINSSEKLKEKMKDDLESIEKMFGYQLEREKEKKILNKQTGK